MKKILVIGATGMAGHIVYLFLKERGNFLMYNTTYRTQLTKDSIVCDVSNEEDILSVIKKITPDYVINCVGALVNESKKHPANTIYLNSYFPHYLANVANDHGFKLIHISTDCVFSGKSGSYGENSFRDADDLYGRSKALGEINDKNNLTIRTSIIGPELKYNGEGLFHWLMMQAGSILGYTNAFWSGITTLELAKAIEKVINNNLTGLVNVTNGARINKFDLLSLLNTSFRHGSIIIEPHIEYKVDKSLLKSSIFDFEIPDYQKMIFDLKEWIIKHDIYKYNL